LFSNNIPLAKILYISKESQILSGDLFIIFKVYFVFK